MGTVLIKIFSAQMEQGEPMEKQQAIDLLDNLIGMIEDNQDNDYDTAFRMAIEALKAQLSQERTTKDAISRQAAIDALQNCRKLCVDPFDSYHIDIQDAENQLSKVPTIQPVATDTNVGDLISRQAAIDALDCISGVEEVLRSLPTIQPQSTTGQLNDGVRSTARSTDLIDRGQAIEKFTMTAPQMSVIRIYEAVEILESMPTIQPEPKEGYWIKHETPDGGEQYECSRCGVLWEFNDGTPEDNEAYFCPKCGSYVGGGRK